MKNKTLYVIVDYNSKDNSYLQYAVDNLVFENEETAKEYMKIKPYNDNMQVEELILYPED